MKWLDLGTNSADSVDYPDFAGKLADAIEAGKAGRGILICRSGIGIFDRRQPPCANPLRAWA